jgi:vacuolar-type H+-ATPase subunit E/Vma4
MKQRQSAQTGDGAQEDRTAGGGDLIAGITADAKAESDRLLSEARQAAEERVKAAEAQAAGILREAGEKAGAQAEAIRSQARSAMRMEAKRTSLKVREEALRRVLAAAREQLAALAERKEYREVLRAWIVEAAVGLGVPEATVNASARERELVDGTLLKEAEREVTSLTGRTVSLQPAQGEPLVGQGVVLRSSDGRLQYNNQVSTRLLRYQSEIRKIVFEALER